MPPSSGPPLVVFCHLRWDFVWQRPQQLMSRFARNRRVYFVEEPIFRDAGEGGRSEGEEARRAPAPGGDASDGARLERRESEGVTVCQPVCRDPGPDGGSTVDAMYTRLAAELVESEGL